MTEDKQVLSTHISSVSKTIEVLILSDSSLQVEAIISILDKTQLQIECHQAATKAEYCDYLEKKSSALVSADRPWKSSRVTPPLKTETNLDPNSLASGDRLDAQLTLILWDRAFTQITLNEAIAFLASNNLQIPLVVVNGEANIAHAVAAIKAGATNYIATDELERLPEVVLATLAELNVWQTQHTTASELQLEKLITEHPDGIIVVNEQRIVKFINFAASELLGKSSEELIGESLGFPVVNGDYLEVDIPRSPTEILVAQMRVSQIQWQGKNAFVVSLRDITQLKQAEEERAKLLEEAQAANRAKDEFLAILSHELRTPLNPIVGWSQLLTMGNLSQSQIKEGAKIIQRNAMLQTQLIEDVLDVSRIIRGKLNLQPTSINLKTTINDALDTVKLAAQAKSIAIETKFDQNIGLIHGDATRIQQVVWNLLSNAVKFTPNHGRVEISLTSTDKILDREYTTEHKRFTYARIQVVDSGKGIQPQFLPYVFDYFRQAESTKSRSEGGLGLGLAIVRRIVELHGGEVTAQSPGLGKGATFTVFLPIVKNQDSVVSDKISLG